MPMVNVEPASGWSAKPFAPGFLARDSVNCHVAQGDPRWDRGYRILKQITSGVFNKGGGSFSHRHTDGTYWPFFWFDRVWYRLNLAGTVSSMVSSLVDYFVPEVVHFPAPGGVSAGFIGDNAKAYGFRKEMELEEFLWDLAVIGGSVTATASASGGSLATGTYHVAITQIDTTGARTVESAPIFKLSIAVTGPTGSISLDLSAATFATRATKYRVYVTAANGADAATAYFQTGADTAKATTPFVITNNTAGTAIPHRLTLYQQATLAVAAVRSAAIYEERLVYGSEGSPYVFFSERADINHYY
ncbi:MAG: hypothetical protein L0206_09110, partial [Actinobacteria bacterium]|nr:hypothetical protein [Actinomycetota bacterium]